MFKSSLRNLPAVLYILAHRMVEKETEAVDKEKKPESDNASDYCPVCSRRLEGRSCKLVCPVCGYYMSCSDYY